MTRRRTLAGALLALSAAAALFAAARSAPTLAGRTSATLAALGPDLARRARFGFDDPERANWHFIPRERRGVALKEMDDAGRAATHALLGDLLSREGALIADAIMDLDDELRAEERAAGGDGASRDASLYFLSVFGEPDDADDGKPWGVRFEGHHLSLNFTRAGGKTSLTPLFLGAHPAEIRSGPRAGRRALAEPEELGHALIVSLSEEQAKRACLSSDPPRDILLGPGLPVALPATEGIAAGALDSTTQQPLLRALVRSVTSVPNAALDSDAAADRAADADLRFAFAGSPAPGKGCYFRVWNERFAIELDNVQNGANHVHLVWRDAHDDFGARLIAEHLKSHAHDRGK